MKKAKAKEKEKEKEKKEKKKMMKNKQKKAEDRTVKVGRQKMGEGICSSGANYVNENGERIASVQ
jgi:hypothetical protein